MDAIATATAQSFTRFTIKVYEPLRGRPTRGACSASHAATGTSPPCIALICMMFAAFIGGFDHVCEALLLAHSVRWLCATTLLGKLVLATAVSIASGIEVLLLAQDLWCLIDIKALSLSCQHVGHRSGPKQSPSEWEHRS